MQKIALTTLAAAALYAAPASAQVYYNGPGYGVHIEPRYERDYDGPRYYHRRYRRERVYADPGHPYGYNYNYGDPRCGRPNFTIQDGVCKPYTGR
jgi:hypothetical protein